MSARCGAPSLAVPCLGSRPSATGVGGTSPAGRGDGTQGMERRDGFPADGIFSAGTPTGMRRSLDAAQINAELRGEFGGE